MRARVREERERGAGVRIDRARERLRRAVASRNWSRHLRTVPRLRDSFHGSKFRRRGFRWIDRSISSYVVASSSTARARPVAGSTSACATVVSPRSGASSEPRPSRWSRPTAWWSPRASSTRTRTTTRSSRSIPSRRCRRTTASRRCSRATAGSPSRRRVPMSAPSSRRCSPRSSRCTPMRWPASRGTSRASPSSSTAGAATSASTWPATSATRTSAAG